MEAAAAWDAAGGSENDDLFWLLADAEPYEPELISPLFEFIRSRHTTSGEA